MHITQFAVSTIKKCNSVTFSILTELCNRQSPLSNTLYLILLLLSLLFYLYWRSMCFYQDPSAPSQIVLQWWKRSSVTISIELQGVQPTAPYGNQTGNPVAQNSHSNQPSHLTDTLYLIVNHRKLPHSIEQSLPILAFL